MIRGLLSRKIACCSFVLISLFLFAATLFAGGVKKVLVVPVNIYSADDLSHVRAGVGAIITNKIEASGASATEYTTSTSGKISKETAKVAAKEIKAQFFVMGDITIFGSTINTDLKLVNTESGFVAFHLRRTGKNMDELMVHVTEFSGEITKYITADSVAGKKDNGGILTEDSPGIAAGWRSNKIKGSVKGVSSGDTDGDGRPEVVFITKGKITLLKKEGGAFKKFHEIKVRPHHKLVGVDIADINKNGKEEIFVTSQSNATKKLISFVLEYDGKGFDKISEDRNVFYRVISRNGGKVLYAQKRTLDKGVYGDEVYEVLWKDGGFKPGSTLKLPGNVSVLDFVSGDLTGDGRDEFVIFSGRGKVTVFNDRMEDLWQSAEEYGGGKYYLEYRKTYSGDLKERVYPSLRMMICDTDGDGINELVVPYNKSSVSRVFSNIKGFSDGQIFGFGWDRFEMSRKWKTRKASGYISDFCVDDIDGDGRAELMYAVDSKSKGFGGGQHSYIYVVEK